MHKRTTVFLGLLFGAATILSAHDLFLKLNSYFVAPNSSVPLALLNGTFSESQGPVARDRIMDISVVSPAGRAHRDTLAITARGGTSELMIKTGEAGTYVAGISLKKRVLALPAAAFNAYLEHDGIPDVLEARRRNNTLDRDVRERYAKHVKAIFQVGSELTDSYGAELGYPAEIVPLENPYALKPGSEFEVRCLVDAKPVADQLVIAGGENERGAFEERSTRTDEHGRAVFTLDTAGKWYVKFIHMTETADGEADYESKWATLTFEVRDDR